MQGIRNIVVGADLRPDGTLSDGAARAIGVASWIASAAGAAITLVHSTRRDERWDPGAEEFAPVQETDLAEARAALADALDSLRADGIPADVVVSEETAWLAIIHQVLRLDAEATVVATRTQASHDGRLIGSVAQKLLRQCPGAVWVAKPGAPPTPETLLAATDLGVVGERVVTWAGWIAKHAGATLDVVHALELPMAVQMEGGDATRAHLDRAHASAVAEIERQLGAAHGAAGSERIHVGLTSPTRAVLEGVDRLDADLVVMGTVSRGGIPGLLIGNTAERLLGRLDCSILTVKPADFVCPVAPVDARAD